jgi:hypothetical protein
VPIASPLEGDGLGEGVGLGDVVGLGEGAVPERKEPDVPNSAMRSASHQLLRTLHSIQ